MAPTPAPKIAQSAILNGYMNEFPIFDILGCFSVNFYYCSSVPNLIGQKMTQKLAPKVAQKWPKSAPKVTQKMAQVC